MWRWVHRIGWLLGLGLAGWVAALCGAAAWTHTGGGGDAILVPLVVVGVAVGLLAATLLAEATWGRIRVHRWLAFGGGAAVLIGLVVGAACFVAGLTEDYNNPEVPLAGLGYVLLGMLAFCGAAVGAALALAGVCGIVAHRRRTPRT